MSLATIMSFILPILTKLFSSLIDRFARNGVSTIKGTAVGVAVVGMMQYLGCDMELADAAIVGGVAALPLLLDKDHGQPAETILEGIKARVEAIKKSRAVLEAALAEQEAAAKAAGIK